MNKIAVQKPVIPRSTNQTSVVGHSASISTDAAVIAAATPNERIWPTSASNCGPAKQPATKPAKYQAPKAPMEMFENPSMLARQAREKKKGCGREAQAQGQSAGTCRDALEGPTEERAQAASGRTPSLPRKADHAAAEGGTGSSATRKCRQRLRSRPRSHAGEL